MGQVTSRPVDTEPATEQDLDTYRQAQEQLDQLRVPVLLPNDNPHARLYIAALDGTGNSMVNDAPENWSSVARIYKQIQGMQDEGITSIAGGYVEGTFTQEGALRTPERLSDGRFGHSFDERVETAYYDFCMQAREWLIEDPQAEIRIAGIGFSRGSEQVAALQRLIEERGIRDPKDAVVVRDRDEVIQRIEYADRPLLVAPGKTMQAALLYDPVSTGVEDEERDMPKSNMGTFEIGAIHDRRDMFKNNDHIPPGFSEDRRNLNVDVAGSHSDVGGTYEKNGLRIMSFNLGVDFLNRLSDEPFLDKQERPADPGQYVIHRSDQHMMGLYGTRSYDDDGVRDRLQDQSPRPGIQSKAPIDEEMDGQLERRTGPNPVMRPEADSTQSWRKSLTGDRDLDAILEAAVRGDDQALVAAAHRIHDSPAGQAIVRQAQYQFQQQEAELQLLAQQREQQMFQQNEQQRGPVRSMMG